MYSELQKRVDACPPDRYEYVRKFGEEEAQYLMEAMGAWKKHYDRMLFIDLGLGDHDALYYHQVYEELASR